METLSSTTEFGSLMKEVSLSLVESLSALWLSWWSIMDVILMGFVLTSRSLVYWSVDHQHYHFKVGKHWGGGLKAQSGEVFLVFSFFG